MSLVHNKFILRQNPVDIGDENSEIFKGIIISLTKKKIYPFIPNCDLYKLLNINDIRFYFTFDNEILYLMKNCGTWSKIFIVDDTLQTEDDKIALPLLSSLSSLPSLSLLPSLPLLPPLSKEDKISVGFNISRNEIPR